MKVAETCPACGDTAEYGSSPADGHLLWHSSAYERHYPEQASRRAERLQARATRECRHPHARHRHGTRVAYVKDRCRCPDCTAANTAASRNANRERMYGRWQPYVDAAPVRAHIAALRTAGIGVERIAALAGISVSHVRELAKPSRDISPGTRHVRPSTATRILNIDIDDASRAPHSHVDATGTRRRLQALAAIGWTTELLAAQLGRRPNSLRRSMSSGSVTAGTARAVISLYEQLWNSRPPRATAEQRTATDTAQANAASQGWLAPLAWDDIDTDPTPPVPTPRPVQRNDIDEIAVERALAGDNISYDDLTPGEQQEVIRQLSARGTSIRVIAAQLGTTKRTVSRRRASRGAA